MKTYLIFHCEIQNRLDELIQRENLAKSLHRLIENDCGIFIDNRITYNAVRLKAHRRGYSMPEYVCDIIALARMEKRLDGLRNGITPIRDRGYGGATYCTMEGSYSLVATVTTKGLRG